MPADEIQQEQRQNGASEPTYFPAFDGIRAIAITFVFVNHYSDFHAGRLGVSVFFVLSGFLITRVLLKLRDQPRRWSRFYARRTFRIFPAYYVFFLAALLASPWLHLLWNRANWLYLVYLGNYIWPLFGTRFDVSPLFIHLGYGYGDPNVTGQFLCMGHFWTLCVEEQFYLLWPILLFKTKHFASLQRRCLLIFATVIAAKFAIAFYSQGFPNYWQRNTLLRGDEFAVGGILAIAIGMQPLTFLKRHSGKLLTALSLLLIACCIVDANLAAPLIEARWDFLANTLAADLFAAILLLHCMTTTSPVVRALSWSPLRRLGQISYGFYIWHDVYHLLLWHFITDHLPHAPEALRDTLVSVSAFALTLLIATLSFRYIETPFLRLKDRWDGRSVVAADPG